MKTLETLYHEIAADPSLREELARAVQRGEAARFLADLGCQASTHFPIQPDKVRG